MGSVQTNTCERRANGATLPSDPFLHLEHSESELLSCLHGQFTRPPPAFPRTPVTWGAASVRTLMQQVWGEFLSSSPLRPRLLVHGPTLQSKEPGAWVPGVAGQESKDGDHQVTVVQMRLPAY